MEKFESIEIVLDATEQALYETALKQNASLTKEEFMRLRKEALSRPGNSEGAFEGNGVIMQGDAPEAVDIHDQYE